MLDDNTNLLRNMFPFLTKSQNLKLPKKKKKNLQLFTPKNICIYKPRDFRDRKRERGKKGKKKIKMGET